MLRIALPREAAEASAATGERKVWPFPGRSMDRAVVRRDGRASLASDPDRATQGGDEPAGEGSWAREEQRKNLPNADRAIPSSSRAGVVSSSIG